MNQGMQTASETHLPYPADARAALARVPDTRHETGGRRRVDWEASENAARLDAFVVAMREGIHVPTTLYNEGKREMRDLRDRARRGERGNVFVIGGQAGAGKSWLMDRNLLAADFPEIRTRWADPMPVLRLDAPSPGRMKALIVKMLSKVSGYEVSDRPSEPMLMRQFLKVAGERGVRIIKIDEFQHIVNLSRTDRHERTVSETLKTLLNETDIQLVLAGEPSVLTFFERWKQFERRGVQLPMAPFACEAGRADFSAFLEDYDQQLADLDCDGKRIGKSGFADKVDRFQLATGGYVGLASKLIHSAAEMSYKAGEDAVDNTLAVAYERWRRCGDQRNPFLMEDAQLGKALGSASKPAAAGGTRMRGIGGIVEPSYGK